MAAGGTGRALVAGGAGFLGSHLCAALIAAGHSVVCVDNLMTGSLANVSALAADPGFTLVEADIVDPLPRQVSQARFDTVWNLACPASPPAYQADPEHTLLTNVIGTRHLLQVAAANDARFLLTSTSEVYGDPLEHPQREAYRGNVSPTGPRACYDEGKRAAETLALDYARAGRAEVRIARIFNTYGPRLAPGDGRVVSNLIDQALAGHPLTIYGDGRQTRSFCYVDDLIAGLLALMAFDGPQPGPVNLGNPAEITILELASAVAEQTGTPDVIVQHLGLPVDDPQRRRPDVTLAHRLLGWQPTISLAQGLAATVAWQRALAAPAAARQPVREPAIELSLA